MSLSDSLNSERWSRVRAILEEILEAPAAERAAILGRHCGDEPALRAEVETFLRAAERLEKEASEQNFLETPVDAGQLLNAVASAEPARIDAGGPDPLIGRSLGAYRITGVLGEGGMGIVYEAEQQNPRRGVALKVIRGGSLDMEKRLRTFHRESEALARLRHPGIAAIYEAGVSEEGLHFFAMERVSGRPLGRLLDEWRSRPALDKAEIRARLSLFLEIGDILSYAHQRGVIHRDLKPSNIHVMNEVSETSSSTSGLGRVKLLDFGLARLTNIDGGEDVTRTMDTAIQGTLTHMSPEQAGGNPDEIDLRTDVYSLGVILYEMLTGRLPHELSRSRLMESLRIIAEEPPRAPSQSDRLLAGDIETILLKTLDKSADRRYQSVAALTDDLRRYLSDLPIEARPTTLAYQVLKLSQRHRTATILVAALVLAVILGAAGTTVGMVRARGAAAVARREAETAEQALLFMERLFRVSNPGEARGNSITARELLDAGAARIDTSLVGEPMARGRLLGVMGEVYRNLGLYPQARPLLEQALELRKITLPPDDPRIATSEYVLAGLCRRLGEYDLARTHYQSSLAIREKAFGPDHPDVAASLTGLANILLQTGDYAGARPLYERCLAIVEKTRGPESPDLAIYLSNLALLDRATNNFASARVLAERAVAIHEKALGPDHPDLTYDLISLGAALRGLQDYDGATRVLERTLAIQEKALGADHLDVAETLTELGMCHYYRGDLARSRPLLERAERIFVSTLGEANLYTAIVRDDLSLVLCDEGKIDSALALSTKALRIFDDLNESDHPSAAMVLEHMASHHLKAGRPREALGLFDRAYKIRRDALGAGSIEAVVTLRYILEGCSPVLERTRTLELYSEIAAALGNPVPDWADSSWTDFMERGAEELRSGGDPDSALVLEESRRQLVEHLQSDR